ncbi:hypothetical protein OIU76_023214 [Salix suchowensis]|nr:hypothetical protein OIU76_023214 [Salix suchowensis]
MLNISQLPLIATKMLKAFSWRMDVGGRNIEVQVFGFLIKMLAIQTIIERIELDLDHYKKKKKKIHWKISAKIIQKTRIFFFNCTKISTKF